MTSQGGSARHMEGMHTWRTLMHSGVHLCVVSGLWVGDWTTPVWMSGPPVRPRPRAPVCPPWTIPKHDYKSTATQHIYIMGMLVITRIAAHA